MPIGISIPPIFVKAVPLGGLSIDTICGQDCGVGGKAFTINGYDGTAYTFSIALGGSYTGTGSNIRVYRWNQTPNSGRTGMTLLGTVAAPGVFLFTPASSNNWLSFFAQNPAKSNVWDGLCVTVSGQAFTMGAFQ